MIKLKEMIEVRTRTPAQKYGVATLKGHLSGNQQEIQQGNPADYLEDIAWIVKGEDSSDEKITKITELLRYYKQQTGK